MIDKARRDSNAWIINLTTETLESNTETLKMNNATPFLTTLEIHFWLFKSICEILKFENWYELIKFLKATNMVMNSIF